jgi:hypothetical protein
MLSVTLALGTVFVCLRSNVFRRYPFLNIYLLVTVAFTCGCYYVRSAFGYTSLEYFKFYYTGDAVLTVVLYLLIGSLFDQMFRNSSFHRYVRPTLAIFFFLVVGVSALFIMRNVDHLYSRFVIELQQNMYFVGVLLTFLLWTSMSWLGAESRRFALVVSGMGIFFAALAGNYALRFLWGGVDKVATGVIPPLAYTVMVSLWLYTFLRVPEGEPARTRLRLREAPVPVSFWRE